MLARQWRTEAAQTCSAVAIQAYQSRSRRRAEDARRHVLGETKLVGQLAYVARPVGQRVRETEAEAVAYVVSHAIGLDTGSAAQDYIQLYDGDAKLLTESLEYIQQTANAILQGIGAEGESSPPI